MKRMDNPSKRPLREADLESLGAKTRRTEVGQPEDWDVEEFDNETGHYESKYEYYKRFKSYVLNPSKTPVLYPSLNKRPRLVENTSAVSKVLVVGVTSYYRADVPGPGVNPNINPLDQPTPTLITVQQPLPFGQRGFVINPLERNFGQKIRTYVQVGPGVPVGWGKKTNATATELAQLGVFEGSGRPFAIVYGYNTQSPNGITAGNVPVTSSFDNQYVVGGFVPNTVQLVYGAWWDSWHPRATETFFLPLIDRETKEDAQPKVADITVVARCTAARLSQVITGGGNVIQATSGNHVAVYTTDFHRFPSRDLLTTWTDASLIGGAWSDETISDIVGGTTQTIAIRGMDVDTDMRGLYRELYVYASWKGNLSVNWGQGQSLPPGFATEPNFIAFPDTDAVGIPAPTYIQIRCRNGWELYGYHGNPIAGPNGEPNGNTWGSRIGYPPFFTPNISEGNPVPLSIELDQVPPFEYPQWRFLCGLKIGASWALYGSSIIPESFTLGVPVSLPFDMQASTEFSVPHTGPGRPIGEVYEITVIDVWAAIEAGNSTWTNQATSNGAYVSGVGTKPPGEIVTKQVQRTVTIANSTKLGYPSSLKAPGQNLRSINQSNYGPYGPTGWTAETGHTSASWANGGSYDQNTTVPITTDGGAPAYQAPLFADGTQVVLETPEYTSEQKQHVAGYQHVTSLIVVSYPNVIFLEAELLVQEGSSGIFQFWSGVQPGQTVTTILDTGVEIVPGPQFVQYLNRNVSGTRETLIPFKAVDMLAQDTAKGGMRYAYPKKEEY
jgi:hypothetical protein